MKNISGKLLLLSFLILLVVFVAVKLSYDSLLDPIRGVKSTAAELDPYTKGAVFALSFVLLLISSLAYQRTGTAKFFFIALAFFLFSFKHAIKLINIFIGKGVFLTDPAENVMDLAILAFLILAIFKK